MHLFIYLYTLDTLQGITLCLLLQVAVSLMKVNKRSWEQVGWWAGINIGDYARIQGSSCRSFIIIDKGLLDMDTMAWKNEVEISFGWLDREHYWLYFLFMVTSFSLSLFSLFLSSNSSIIINIPFSLSLLAFYDSSFSLQLDIHRHVLSNQKGRL